MSCTSLEGGIRADALALRRESTTVADGAIGKQPPLCPYADAKANGLRSVLFTHGKLWDDKHSRRVSARMTNQLWKKRKHWPH